MQKSITHRLAELERRARLTVEQQRLSGAAAAANAQPGHWSESREWKEVLLLFRLSDIYNELPAYVTPDGRVALPTPAWPVHWGNPPAPYLTAAHERAEAIVANLNAARDAGAVLILLTLAEIAQVRAGRHSPELAEHLQLAIAAYEAQTHEHVDTPIARLEWVETIWRAWKDYA